MNVLLSREIRAFASGSTVTLGALADIGDKVTRAALGRGHHSEVIDLEGVELLYQLAKHLKQVSNLHAYGFRKSRLEPDEDITNPMTDPRL